MLDFANLIIFFESTTCGDVEFFYNIPQSAVERNVNNLIKIL